MTNTQDPTEDIRREQQAAINSSDADRACLEAEYGVGNVWNTDELKRDFDVTNFLAPYVSVTRKSDGQVGSLMFKHSPRLYFGWKEYNS